MNNRRVRVLYVCGFSRSGSTLLDRMLGEFPNHTSCGELQKFWEYGIRDNKLCTCGNPVLQCPFWSKVIDRSFDGDKEIPLSEYLSNKQSMRMRNLLQVLYPKTRSEAYRRRFDAYAKEWLKVLNAIHEISGQNIIVDSSKAPHQLFAMIGFPNIDVQVVHLVRDSRAVAFSYGRAKLSREKLGESRFIKGGGAFSSGLAWLRWNLLFELFRSRTLKVTRVRYEDLVADPETQLRRVAAMTNVCVDSSDFLTVEGVSTKAGHLLAGNPMRFQRGKLTLQLDDEWRYTMPRWKRIVVTLLTFPLLMRYGYPIRTKKSTSSADFPS